MIPLHMQGLYLLKLLLASEPVVVLNSALCEHHLKHCPITEQLLTQCSKVCRHRISLGCKILRAGWALNAFGQLRIERMPRVCLFLI